jgi:hypothetical protein
VFSNDENGSLNTAQSNITASSIGRSELSVGRRSNAVSTESPSITWPKTV